MAPIPVEHSYIVPTGQTYYPSGQQQMYPVRQYGHEIFGLDKKKKKKIDLSKNNM